MLRSIRPWLVCSALLAACGEPDPAAQIGAQRAALEEDRGHDGQAAYRFSTFDHPNATSLTYAIGLNNRGDVSGAYDLPDGRLRGYVRFGGRFQSIDYPGALSTICAGITDQRQVTGVYVDQQGFQHGFHWQDGRFARIDVPGAAQTTGINFEFGPGLGTAAFRTTERGQIVGEYADSAGFARGFVLTGGALRSIDFPGASHSPGFGTEVIAINNSGVLGGSYYTDTPPFVHAYLSADRGLRALSIPGSGGTFGSQVNGINDAGVVVGPYTDASDVFHGFIWRDGRSTTLDFPGAIYTEIDSINDQGDLSGAWGDPSGVTHGYVATRCD